MAITGEQIRILRLIKRTAPVYLLLLYLDKPVHVIEVARLLEIDRQTARNYLFSLAFIGLVQRTDWLEGFALTDKGRQMAPPGTGLCRGVEEVPPAIVVNTVKDSDIDQSLTTTENQAEEIPPQASEEVWQALAAAGISRNPRTERLARREYITPDYVTGHYLNLQRAGKAERTGLLVSILESGVPAPALNANRHLGDCQCSACITLKYKTCPYCGQYPCECDESAD